MKRHPLDLPLLTKLATALAGEAGYNRPMTDSATEFAPLKCRNCDYPMDGLFCSQCGQQEREVLRPFLHFLKELVRVLLDLDGRAYRTIYYLLTRPGFLTREYFDGRRQRYTPPLRLFLVVSIGFFLLISVANTFQSMSEAFNPPTVDAESATISQDDDAEGEETSIDDFQDLLNSVAQIEVPFLSAAANGNLQNFLSSQLETNLNEMLEDPQDFFVNSLEYITFFMLAMMPILALIQKILWIFSGRYYVEHLVLTVHNQSFLFLMMLLLFLTGASDRIGISAITAAFDFLSVIALLWMLVYLLISLKVYFQRGWVLTVTLFAIMSAVYSIVLSTGMLMFGAALVIFS